MLTITNTAVAREQVWTAFCHTHDVRLRERYHSVLLLMDGKTSYGQKTRTRRDSRG